jgi:sporulation protein YlmC with PRC-barrel domain
MKAGRRLAPVPPVAGRTLDAQLHLLDRQVLDNDGVPVTTVDDLELSGPETETAIPPGSPPPVITALLTGPVLGTRIFGGRPPSSRLIRIPWKDVSDVGVVIRLGVSGENLESGWVERWIRDKIIARIPGGRHDPR